MAGSFSAMQNASAYSMIVAVLTDVVERHGLKLPGYTPCDRTSHCSFSTSKMRLTPAPKTSVSMSVGFRVGSWPFLI